MDELKIHDQAAGAEQRPQALRIQIVGLNPIHEIVKCSTLTSLCN
jgi:hypothetical protein